MTQVYDKVKLDEISTNFIDSIAGHQRPVSRRWPIYGSFLVFMNIYHFHAPTRKQNLFSVKICVHKVCVKKVTYIGMRKHYRDW